MGITSVTPKLIANLVSREFQKFLWDILEPTTCPDMPRRIAITLSVDFCNTSIAEVAKFYRQDSVILCADAVSKMAKSDEVLAKQLRHLRKQIPQMWPEAIRTRRPSSIDIKVATAQHFEFGLHRLTGPERTLRFARPRQIAMALCRQLTNLSLPQIGAAFGPRDHTTVLSACRRIDFLYATSEETAWNIDKIRSDVCKNIEDCATPHSSKPARALT